MNCKLIGNVYQALEVTLNPHETFFGERGAMIYMDSNIDQEVLMSGSGFAFQKVTGDSTVFFDCIDALLERDLAPGEEIIVDENHIKAMLGISDSQISIQRNTNIVRNLVSGEGFLLTRISGSGKVFLSTIPSIIR